MIDVAIVEDNDIIREKLTSLISSADEYRCVGSYRDCESMLKELRDVIPDVLLMDIRLPGISGIEGVRRVKEVFPELDILMLTVHEESEIVFEALYAGASGYLIKKTSPARLLEAIREIYEGGSPMSAPIARQVVNLFQQNKPLPNGNVIYSPENPNPLTQRELEILEGLVEGNSYQAIGDSLFISTNTVRFHIRNIYRKLHVHSQSEAVAKALRNGLV